MKGDPEMGHLFYFQMELLQQFCEVNPDTG